MSRTRNFEKTRAHLS